MNRLTSMLIVLCALLACVAHAYTGRFYGQDENVLKQCENEDCYAITEKNVKLIIYKRTRPTKEQFCELGNLEKTQAQILADVRRFCENHHLESSRNAIINENEINLGQHALENPKNLEELRQELAPKFPELMNSISKAFIAWKKVKPQLPIDIDRAQKMTAGIADDEFIGYGANMDHDPLNNKVLITPFFANFLKPKAGIGHAWLVTAHEYAQGLTTTVESFQPEILDQKVGTTETVKSCSIKLLNASEDEGDLYHPGVVSADYLVAGALAYAQPMTEGPEKAREFLTQATAPLCALFHQQRVSDQRLLKQEFLNNEGIPFIWNRINIYFTNNKVRQQLGCEIFKGLENQCHNW